MHKNLLIYLAVFVPRNIKTIPLVVSFPFPYCSYKAMFTRLKGLKIEIEHLQLLLEKAKVKLQKDFEVWWSEEATRLQVSWFLHSDYLKAVLY